MGYRLERNKKSFRLYDEKTDLLILDEKIITRVKKLVIPPAWSSVRIAKSASAKVLAHGRDAKNRKQYIYNPRFIKKREKQKFDRIVEFSRRLPKFRETMSTHLKVKDFTRNKVLAIMVKLLDEAQFRPGSRRYAKENETYGLTTLRSRHLNIEENEISFHYCGKSGKFQHKYIEDRQLVTLIKRLDDISGHEIFKYFEDGKKHYVDQADLNNYIKEHLGEDFSAKDFRTYAGTLLAALLLDEIALEDELINNQKKINKVIDQVALKLGNTREVAKSSYIDPRVIEKFSQGQTIGNYIEAAKAEFTGADLADIEELALQKLLSL